MCFWFAVGNRLPIALASSDAVAAHMEKVASQTLNLLRPFQQMCKSKKVILKLYVFLDSFDYETGVFPCQTGAVVFTHCQWKSGASRKHCARRS
jgi:hypothetical protein